MPVFLRDIDKLATEPPSTGSPRHWSHSTCDTLACPERKREIGNHDPASLSAVPDARREEDRTDTHGCNIGKLKDGEEWLAVQTKTTIANQRPDLPQITFRSHTSVDFSSYLARICPKCNTAIDTLASTPQPHIVSTFSQACFFSLRCHVRSWASCALTHSRSPSEAFRLSFQLDQESSNLRTHRTSLLQWFLRTMQASIIFEYGKYNRMATAKTICVDVATERLRMFICSRASTTRVLSLHVTIWTFLVLATATFRVVRLHRIL